MRTAAKVAARGAIPGVLLVQALLVWSGVLSLGQAVVIGLLLEVLLAGLVIAEIALARRAYREARREGEDGLVALREAVSAVLPGPVARVVVLEVGLLRALWRWLRRAPDVPPGQVALAYGGQLRSTMWVMVALTPVELLAAHFLLPWQAVRVVVLLLAPYGALWALGFLGALSTRPHLLGEPQLTLRFAHFAQVRVPLTAPGEVSAVRHSGYRRAVNIADGVLAMPVGDSTTVAVRLAEPVRVRAKPGAPEQEITEVRFAVDDPEETVAMLRERVPRVPSDDGTAHG